MLVAQVANALPASLNGLLQQDLRIQGTQLTWITAAFMVVVIVFEFSFGVLGDLCGRKRLVAGGALLIAIGSVVFAVAPNVQAVWAGAAISGLPPDAFHLPVGRPVTHKIYRDALHPARLVLPSGRALVGHSLYPCPEWTSTVCWIYHGGIRMEFEFDPVKSASNREKHGIDFVQAQELWQDPMRIEVPARTTDEQRWLVVGRMGGRHWSAVVTYRTDKIRIISVRRARDEEIRIYEV